jgi:hypothetical protein
MSVEQLDIIAPEGTQFVAISFPCANYNGQGEAVLSYTN